VLLYYITDRRAFAEDESHRHRALLARVAEAAAAGVDYIQLREKDLTARELESLATEAVAAVRANSQITRILINQRADVALACGADGVHLPGNSLPASEVRTLWMRVADRAPVIGVSAHSIDDVRYAEAHGADFAVLAPIFEKSGTELPGLGLDLLSIACRGPQPPDNTESMPQSSFRVLALGGMNLGNAVACIRVGASGVAGIRLFQEGNLGKTVRTLRQVASQPWASAEVRP
jgi:thiamine-phosphate pyrophosphorylase